MASTLRWRKQLHRVYIEAFAHPQFLRCKLNQNKRSRHSVFFFFEAMQGYDDNNQKSFYSVIVSTRNYVEKIFAPLQIIQTLSQEHQFTQIWKAVHTTPFLYFTTGPPQNYLIRMKNRSPSYIYYAQAILQMSRKVISRSQKTMPIFSLFAKNLL